MFRPDGREAPEWMPHDRESWERLAIETPIFSEVFTDKGICPLQNPECEWTIWDGDDHPDPPEYGYHSSGCRDPYHCGRCDTSEAIAELHQEMAQIEMWRRQDADYFDSREPLFEPDDHDAWGFR